MAQRELEEQRERDKDMQLRSLQAQPPQPTIPAAAPAHQQPQPQAQAGGAASKAERWKQRAAAAAAGGVEASPAPAVSGGASSGAAAPQAAPAPAMSKAERWKQRAAAGAGGAGALQGSEAAAAPVPAAQGSASTQGSTQGGAQGCGGAAAAPMTKAERWKMRATGATPAAAAAAPPAAGTGAEAHNGTPGTATGAAAGQHAGAGAAALGPGEGGEGFTGQHRDTRPVMMPTGVSALIPDEALDPAARPGADRRPYADPALKVGYWQIDSDGKETISGELPQPDAGQAVSADANKLLYMQIQTSDFRYSGWTRGGEPDVSGSMWFKDLSEYHGSISAGKPHGDGKHYFADGARLECAFVHGCPEGPGILIDAHGTYFNVMYQGGVSLQDGAQPALQEETRPEAFRPTKAECVALTIGSPQPVAGTENPATGKPRLAGVFPNSKDVRGKLVWARPPFADMPLWNAEQVKGKIVAIVRGPAAPATAVSYGLKLHHAQQAGAKAVVFVDYDPNGKFDAMPRIDEGVVQYGVRPSPPDVDIRAQIPTVLVLNRHTATLQEGALHVLAFAPPGFPGIPYGWKVGFVCVPPQESKVGLSKDKADALMAEFFAERKKERLEEGQLLKDIKDSGEDQAEKGLKSREFYGGNFFDSLNPLKQVKETDGVDDKVRNSVIINMQRVTGVNDANIKEMRSKLEKFTADMQAKLPTMPTLPGITWEEEEAAEGETQGEFTLASWRKKAGIKVPKWQQQQKAKAAQAVCDHGQLKKECPQCRDPLKGCFITEHNPNLPCLAGHGPRWLFHDTEDDSLIEKRQLGILSLSLSLHVCVCVCVCVRVTRHMLRFGVVAFGV